MSATDAEVAVNVGVNSSVKFNLVKYILIIIYVFDLIYQILLIIVGVYMKLNIENDLTNRYKSGIIDEKIDPKNLIMGCSVASIVFIYFIFAAYNEYLRPNVWIAIVSTVVTIASFFLLKSQRVYSVIELILQYFYCFLIYDKKSTQRSSDEQLSRSDVEMDANNDNLSESYDPGVDDSVDNRVYYVNDHYMDNEVGADVNRYRQRF